MDGERQTLQADAERADMVHFRIVPCKQENNLIRENAHKNRHDDTAQNSHKGGETVAFPYSVITLCPPVEPGYRLEAGSETEDDAEGEHHNFGADTNAGQNRVGNITRDVIDQDRRKHRQTGSEHGGGSYAYDREKDIL